MNGSLGGLRVVNTRAVHQASALDRLLTERGAVSIPYPCIAIVPPADTAELDWSLRRLAAGEFDRLVFTSANAVAAVTSRCARLGIRNAVHPNTSVAAVGPASADAANELLGRSPAVVPDTHTGTELARAIHVRPSERVLLPLSEIAGDDVARGLRRLGADVTEVTAYRTVTGHGGVDLPGMLATNAVDAITFCSPSAVAGFVERMTRENGSLPSAHARTVVCIGPSTHEAAVRHGFMEAVGATIHTLDGLVAELEQVGAVRPQGGNRWS